MRGEEWVRRTGRDHSIPAEDHIRNLDVDRAWSAAAVVAWAEQEETPAAQTGSHDDAADDDSQGVGPGDCSQLVR